MKDLQGLKSDRDIGSKYQTLINNVGWQLLKNELSDDWMTALKSLTKFEDEKSRIRMQVIEDIINKVETGIDFGERAKNKLLNLK